MKQREYEKENAKLAAEEQDKQRSFEQETSKVEADKLVFLKEKQEQELQIEKDRQAHELIKIKAQQDHELVLEQQTVAIARAQREYDAAAEEKSKHMNFEC